VSCFGFQPAQAEAIFQSWMAAEPSLQWRSGMGLCELQKSGDRLSSALLEGEAGLLKVDFELLVDGTELAESLAIAQLPHRLGWEAQELWQEPSAPSQQRLNSEPFFQQQPVQSPTWVVLGQWQGSWPTELPCNDVAEPFAGCVAGHGLARLLSYGRLPNNQVMLNWPLAGNDWHRDPGAAFSGDRGRIEAQLAGMADHSHSFLAELTRTTAGQLQPAAAFPGSGSLALQPYWRESRRLIGHTTVLEQDLLPQSPRHEHLRTSIAVGNYPNDHHYPGADWPLATKAKPWGGRWSGTPFCIPFAALHGPAASNLLMADKGISVSHMANGATRLGPLVLLVGQAAGLAAALCCQRRCLPAQLPVELLQHALINDRLAPSGPAPLQGLAWHHPHWRERQLQGLMEPDSQQQIPLAGTAPPPEPGEQQVEMELRVEAEDRWRGSWQGEQWPLITLEPEVKRLMADLNGKCVTAVGRANPWGPWWRINRLCR
jgi:hypothetical protein